MTNPEQSRAAMLYRLSSDWLDEAFPDGMGSGSGTSWWTSDDMRDAFEAGYAANRGEGRMHRGIRLRISIPAGPLFNADSDMMHSMAGLIFEEGWHEIIRTVDGLVIESQAVMLPDSYPDD